MKIKRLLVCGSRTWSDRKLMYTKLDGIAHLQQIDVLIHGDARGADRMAGTWAEKHGIIVREYPAEWDRWGRRAGFVRNQQMLDEGRPDYIAAFIHVEPEHMEWSREAKVAASRGTANMISLAKEVGLSGVIVLSR